MNQFHDQGFFLLRNEFNSDEMFQLDNEYHRLIKEAKNILEKTNKNKMSLPEFYKNHPDALIVVPEITNYFEPCRFEYIAHCSAIIKEIIIEKLEKRISQLMSESFILFKDKCNVKNPGGGAFPPHQDFTAYAYFTPRYHVTAAVILDDSTIENGCLEVAVNDDYLGVLLDYYQGGKNNGDIKKELSDKITWKPIEAKKGDVLLFHSFLPHCSKKNESSKPRRNFFFTFNALSEGNWYEYYYDVKKNQFDNPIFHVSTPTEHSGRHDEK